MRLSVIFGTRGDVSSHAHLQRIFHALQQQTFQDFQVLVIVDREFADESAFRTFLDTALPSQSTSFHIHSMLNKEKSSQKIQFFTHLNSDFLPSQNNASYVRNFGIQQADTELIQLFDEDNGFDENYLEKAVQYYDEQKKQLQQKVVICSSMYYRDTGEIQSQGFRRFCYWQSRPIVNRLGKEGVSTSPSLSNPQGGYGAIQMFSGNGLL